MREWLIYRFGDRLKARTYSRYSEMINLHIIPALGERDAEGLGRRDIIAFLAGEKKHGNKRNGGGLSASSINTMLCVLKLAFDYACEMEYTENNPCAGIKRTGTDSRRVEAFSTGEQIAVEKAVEASGDIRLHGIVLCLYTGLRIGELLGLTWEDVDLENGIITVNKTVYRGKDDAGRGCLVVDRPKTKASNRLIPLPDYVIRMLEEDLRRSGSRFVVPGKGGERMPVRTYQHLFRRLTERADVPRKGFHALRHTFATRAVESGMDIRTLADNRSFGTHMCFCGNPGTGKTEVARLLSRILYEAGVLPEGKLTETDAHGLIGKFVGETAVKTEAKINEAMGGVLFIDEAYSLVSASAGNGAGYGDEAIAVLLKYMEDYRGRFCVIFAGYPAETERMISSNPGLKSRIQFRLDFPDYSEAELREIAVRFAGKAGYEMDDSVRDRISGITEYLRGSPDFANARTVRNILDQVILNQNLRTEDCPEDNRIILQDVEDYISEQGIMQKNDPGRRAGFF